jgi:tripartite-type tricarboxylate transporter receptor subunit TctC
MLAPKMAEILGATVIVENRAGANTNIGTQYVAKSAPDGRTLLLGGTALAVNVAIYKEKLPFDPLGDFAPISLIATSNSVLVVNPGLGVASVAELVALLKSQPGQFNYASAGSGNMTHLGMEIFKATTGTAINHVPYRGANPAITDVVAGHIPMMLISPGAVEQHIRDGKLRALAATGPKRLAALPDVPTFSEIGMPMPEVDFGTWFGILAPADTPADLVALLNKAVLQAVHDPDTLRRLTGAGFQPMTTTPDEYRAMLQAQIEKWQPVVDKAGIAIN